MDWSGVLWGSVQVQRPPLPKLGDAHSAPFRNLPGRAVSPGKPLPRGSRYPVSFRHLPPQSHPNCTRGRGGGDPMRSCFLGSTPPLHGALEEQLANRHVE